MSHAVCMHVAVFRIAGEAASCHHTLLLPHPPCKLIYSLQSNIYNSPFICKMKHCMLALDSETRYDMIEEDE